MVAKINFCITGSGYIEKVAQELKHLDIRYFTAQSLGKAIISGQARMLE